MRVVETAYYYEGSFAGDDVECNQNLPYRMTQSGQYSFLKSLREMLLQTKCGAVFCWCSHWSPPDKWFRADESWEDAERCDLFDKEAGL